MVINTFQTLNIIEAMENFIIRIRPPEDIRHQLDIGYKIEQQDIIVFEIRPQWNKPDIILEHPVAKTTYVKSKNHWKIFWMRSNLKWDSYSPQPTVKTIEEFTKIVGEDKHHCFWG